MQISQCARRHPRITRSLALSTATTERLATAIRRSPMRHSARALWKVAPRNPPDQRPLLFESMWESCRALSPEQRHLWVALQGELVVGAAWGQVSPGRQAVVWPPALNRDHKPSIADRLVDAVLDDLSNHGIQLAQAILELSDSRSERLFKAHGFQYAADLQYLFCELTGCLADQTEPLEFERYRESQRTRMLRVIDRTYARTLDVALLNGMRPIDDVVDGYQGSPGYDPDRWFFVRHQESDIGCLLLTDFPEAGHWELTYMGLIPEARGRGWGRKITQFAQQLAQQAGRPRMVLAVDGRNTPALTAYREAGFRPWTCRRALIRTL